MLQISGDWSTHDSGVSKVSYRRRLSTLADYLTGYGKVTLLSFLRQRVAGDDHSTSLETFPTLAAGVGFPSGVSTRMVRTHVCFSALSHTPHIYRTLCQWKSSGLQEQVQTNLSPVKLLCQAASGDFLVDPLLYTLYLQNPFF